MSDIRVNLKCPACFYEWHAATFADSAWWNKGLKPETAAKQCYCPMCDHPPPMQVVTAQQELGL